MNNPLPRERSSAGMTLIETLVAVFVFTVISVGLVSLVVVVVRTALQSEREVAALALATEQIEQVRALDYDDVCTASQGGSCRLPEHWGSDPSSATTLVRGNKEYRVGTIVSTVTGSQADYKKIDVHVQWDTPGGGVRNSRLVTYATKLAEPVRDPIPDFYISLFDAGTLGAVAYDAQDILAYDGTAHEWSMHFDASDVGFDGGKINAFHVLSDDSILISPRSNQSFPGVGPGQVQSTDIVRFVPTSLGSDTSGTFEWFLEGSDVGFNDLTRENIAAISSSPNDKLLVSTAGAYSVPGLSGGDEDVIEFTPTSFGSDSEGTWQLYLDGSDVGLDSSSEDIRALSVDSTSGDVHLSTRGDLSTYGIQTGRARNLGITEVTTTESDIVTFAPTSLGQITAGSYSIFWDGANYGFSEELTGLTVNAGTIVQPSGPTFTVSGNVDFADHGLDAVPFGSTRTEHFTIQNNTAVDATLTDNPPTFLTNLYASAYTVTQQPTSPIPAGGGTTMIIQYHPSDRDRGSTSHGATVNIPYTGPETDTLRVLLWGRATDAPIPTLNYTATIVASGQTYEANGNLSVPAGSDVRFDWSSSGAEDCVDFNGRNGSFSGSEVVTVNISRPFEVRCTHVLNGSVTRTFNLDVE